MKDDERKIKQEDCSEDNLGSGILTLTNKRLAFDKTRSRMLDFSKHMGDTILDISLGDVIKVWKEGLLMRKACFSVKTVEGGEQTYRFGVLNTGSWVNSIVDAVKSSGKNQ